MHQLLQHFMLLLLPEMSTSHPAPCHGVHRARPRSVLRCSCACGWVLHALATTEKKDCFTTAFPWTEEELGHVKGPQFRGWSPCGLVDADEDLAFLALAFHMTIKSTEC